MTIVRLIGNTNLNLSCPSGERVPLVVIPHSVKVGYEFYSTQKDIVTKVISKTISATFGLLCTQVTLQGNLRVSGDIAGKEWMNKEISGGLALPPQIRTTHKCA